MPKATQRRTSSNLQTHAHQLARKFIRGLAPTLCWLLKDLPCNVCAQPVPLATPNSQAQNLKYPKNLLGIMNIDPAEQAKNCSNIILCNACSEALSPRLEGFCQFCALPFPQGSKGFGPCSECVRKKPVWQHIYFVGPYQGLLQQLLLNLKFENGLYAPRVLGKILAQRIQNVQKEEAQKGLLEDLRGNLPSSFSDDLSGNCEFSATLSGNLSNNFLGTPQANLQTCLHNFSCVVPVPLSPQRLKERGYNQSLELARVVAKELDLPLEHNLLLRIKHGIPQEHLNKKERFKAVQGMFAVCPQQSISKRHILLLDDIMTTGATIQECSRVLLAAGAKAVSVAVVARTGLE